MASKVIVFIMLVGSGFGAWGCGSGGDGAAAATNQGPGGPGAGMDQRPAVTVAVTPVVEGTISSRYTASGVLEAEKSATIQARVTGVIESIAAEEGDYVQAGQTLLTVGDDEYQYRVQQAASELEAAKAKYERGRKLVEEKVMSSEAFDDLRSAYEGAEANTGLARLNLSYCKVEAPFAGRITRRQVDPGQTISNGTELFTIADFTPLLAKVHVPSKMLGQLKAEQPVELILDSTGDHLNGRIKLVSPVIDPQSGTIKLTIEVPTYPKHTRPGDFVEVRIVTEKHDRARLVPKMAVIEEKGQQFAFVAVDSTAARRTLQVGFTDDDNAEILSGLEVGDQVVIRGQRNLKDGQAVRIAEDVITENEQNAGETD